MWDMVNNKGFNKSNIKLNKKRIKGTDFIHPSRWMIQVEHQNFQKPTVLFEGQNWPQIEPALNLFNGSSTLQE